jgi:hypothetical protein
MGKTKDLSKDCKNIVLHLFKFFQLEKARGRPFYSPDNLIKRTCKAAGISYSSVYRLDEMHILKMVVKFCRKLSFTVF